MREVFIVVSDHNRNLFQLRKVGCVLRIFDNQLPRPTFVPFEINRDRSVAIQRNQTELYFAKNRDGEVGCVGFELGGTDRAHAAVESVHDERGRHEEQRHGQDHFEQDGTAIATAQTAVEIVEAINRQGHLPLLLVFLFGTRRTQMARREKTECGRLTHRVQ